MIESPNLKRAMYLWEQSKFADLNISLDRYLAEMWFRILKIELGLTEYWISLAFFDGKHDRLHGQTSMGECPHFDNTKAAQIRLWAPHHLRVLGHEFAHLVRWEREGVYGHGGNWRVDVSMVHAIIRKHMPRIHGTPERRQI